MRGKHFCSHVFAMPPELHKEHDAVIHKYFEETACSINEHVTEFDLM